MVEIERQGMIGRLTLVLRDEHGCEVDRREVNNLITNAGRNLVARIFAGVVQAVPKLNIDVGGSDTAADATDASLKGFVASANATVSVNGNVAKVTATLAAAGTGDTQALKEAGIRIQIQNQADVLYNRVTFPVVNKGPNMEMTLSWEVTF
jgi:hypothetical protein